MGAAISEVVNDALVAEAGKNKEGAQEGGWRLHVKLLHLHASISHVHKLAVSSNPLAIRSL
jgi:hypothetical protein